MTDLSSIEAPRVCRNDEILFVNSLKSRQYSEMNMNNGYKKINDKILMGDLNLYSGDDDKHKRAPITMPEKRLRAVLRYYDDCAGWIKFDASESIGIDNDQSTTYYFEFGDITPAVQMTAPFVSRPYMQPGTYQASLHIVDKYGQYDTTSIQVIVNKPSLFLSSPSPTPSCHTPPCRSTPISTGDTSTSTDQTHVFSYNPPSQCGATGNIWIKSNMRTKTIPSRVDISFIGDIVSYLNKSTALQWDYEDDSKYDIGDVKVLDYNFFDKKTQKPLYCLIRRQDEYLPSSRKYKWIMDRKLYNESELQSLDLNPPLITMPTICENTFFKHVLKQKIQNTKITLTKIPIYNKQNVKRDKEIRMTLSVATFREYCKNNQNWQCIPIIMSYCGDIKKRLQYLTIVKTATGECDIGISFTCNSTDNSLFITGFHIDTQSILEQHQLAMSYQHNINCHCLDSWSHNTIITHLTIGKS